MKKIYRLILPIVALSLSSCSLFTKEYDDSNATVVKVTTKISDVYNKVKDSCVGIYCTNLSSSTASIGSGVIFKKDNNAYYVLTNYHVLDEYLDSDYSKFYVYQGSNSQRFKATVTSALDKQKDLAVLKMTPDKDIKTISISKDYHPIVTPGEEVVAIGCPISLDYFNSVCKGVVSKAEYTATNNGGELNVIQNTCPINPGNSGGGLFNLNGDLIGINFKKTTYVNDGGTKVLVDGVDYAIALSEVITFLDINSLI